MSSRHLTFKSMRSALGLHGALAAEVTRRHQLSPCWKGTLGEGGSGSPYPAYLPGIRPQVSGVEANALVPRHHVPNISEEKCSIQQVF